MTKSREKTEEEVRIEFLKHVSGLIDYWASEERADTHPTISRKLEGLTHSILVAIDGRAEGLPKFILAPDPHPDDKQYHIKHDNNYYPENYESNVKCDISVDLHELIYKYRK